MLDRPIFILCIHRSGSTLLKNILNNNSFIAMATDEMHISVPVPSNQAFDKIYKKYDVDDPDQLTALVDEIFSGKIKGTFWKDYSGLGIDKQDILNEIKESDKSIQSIISILLDQYRKMESKDRVGAKYPLHPSRIAMLMEWFPDAKIIFLTRDIRAIIASKLNDEATKRRKKSFGLFSWLVHYSTIFFFAMDFNWYSKIIEKHHDKEYSYAIKYEDIGLDSEKEIRKLSDFLEVPYEEKMLSACGKPSSHGGETKYGFDKSKIEKWRVVLNKFDKFFIRVFCSNSMRRIGYKI